MEIDNMSQREKIYNHLSDGNKLTPVSALVNFGAARLAARIKDIDDMMLPMGCKVPRRMKTVNGNKYMEYGPISVATAAMA
jgi:hypothetical protein